NLRQICSSIIKLRLLFTTYRGSLRLTMGTLGSPYLYVPFGRCAGFKHPSTGTNSPARAPTYRGGRECTQHGNGEVSSQPSCTGAPTTTGRSLQSQHPRPC